MLGTSIWGVLCFFKNFSRWMEKIEKEPAIETSASRLAILFVSRANIAVHQLVVEDD